MSEQVFYEAVIIVQGKSVPHGEKWARTARRRVEAVRVTDTLYFQPERSVEFKVARDSDHVTLSVYDTHTGFLLFDKEFGVLVAGDVVSFR